MMAIDRARLILEGVSPYTDRCHEAMTTDEACLIPWGCITVLCPL